jgi:hypothetical protein
VGEGENEREAVTTSVAIQIATALIGVLVGWALGRLTKQIEFRFDLLQKLIDNYQRTKQAASEFRWALDTQKNLGFAGSAERIRAGEAVARSREQVQFCVSGAVSFGYLVDVAF